MKKIIACFAFLLFISCVGNVIYRPFTAEKYPPTQTVEVYTKEKPEKPYKEIGRIEVKDDDVIKAATRKAKEIGADAIILEHESKEITYESRRNPQTQEIEVTPETKHHAVFLAIKYAEQE